MAGCCRSTFRTESPFPSSPRGKKENPSQSIGKSLLWLIFFVRLCAAQPSMRATTDGSFPPAARSKGGQGATTVRAEGDHEPEPANG